MHEQTISAAATVEAATLQNHHCIIVVSGNCSVSFTRRIKAFADLSPTRLTVQVTISILRTAALKLLPVSRVPAYDNMTIYDTSRTVASLGNGDT